MKGINSLHGLNPGDLFTTDGRDVWELVSFCELPTATVKNLRTGEVRDGAVGCLNLAPFVQLKPAEPIKEQDR